jgi:hypothetical protein
MECKISRVAIETLYEVLRSLEYYPVKVDGRASQWRRSQYHLYTYPFGKRGVRLSLHKDVLAKPAPIFAHKTEIMGKDVTRELQRIVQKYGKLILIGESQI